MDQYFHRDGVGLLCPACAAVPEPATRTQVLAAAGRGLLALAAVTLVWAAIVRLTSARWTILGVVAGATIGAAVRRGAGPARAPGFRVLAVVLTWLAINLVGAARALWTADAPGPGAFALQVVAGPLRRLGADPANDFIGLVLLAIMLITAWAAAAPPPLRPFSLTPDGDQPPLHQRCDACGAGFPFACRACPGCGTFAQIVEVRECLSKARDAQAAGDFDAVAAALREARYCVPAGTSDERLAAAIARAEVREPQTL